MKRALIITTVSGFVPQFEMNNVKILQKLGYEVHYAANYKMPVYGSDNHRLDNTGIIRHQVDFTRSPYKFKNNIKAYKQLLKLMKIIRYDLVHCHTPMGGVLGRLAAKSTNTIPVVYTAHGFHFYRGAPLANWLLYYPVEKYLAKYTNTLITINNEDYNIAKGFRMRLNGTVEFVNGIGINTEISYNNKVSNSDKRQELNIKDGTFILTSVGELTTRKNHEVVLKSISQIKNINLVYLICGVGKLEKHLKKIVNKYKIEEKVLFTGYRKDIHEILKITDCFIFPSLQEGLSVALLEAMSMGLPVICSKIRGNIDLVDNNKGGYLIKPMDVNGYVNSIKTIINNETIRKSFGEYNLHKVKCYDLNKISADMFSIYTRLN